MVVLLTLAMDTTSSMRKPAYPERAISTSAASSTRRTTCSLRPPRTPWVRRADPEVRRMARTLASPPSRWHLAVAFTLEPGYLRPRHGNMLLPSEGNPDALAPRCGLFPRRHIPGQLLPALHRRNVGGPVLLPVRDATVSRALVARGEHPLCALQSHDGLRPARGRREPGAGACATRRHLGGRLRALVGPDRAGRDQAPGQLAVAAGGVARQRWSRRRRFRVTGARMTSFTHDSRRLAETYDRVSDLQFNGGKRLVER